MPHTVADELVERLIEGGVQRIYGVVGDSLNPVTDAVRRRRDKIEWVHVRHEEAGAFAATPRLSSVEGWWRALAAAAPATFI